MIFMLIWLAEYLKKIIKLNNVLEVDKGQYF